MSMYLSNFDVAPTGAEPGEFIDGPLLPAAEDTPPPRRPGAIERDATDVGPG